jgi:hypothetical protein
MPEGLGVLLHDLRYACRTLWRSRTFTMTALTVLALGIGANTTIYTVVRGLAFRPLPFDDPERLVFVGELGPGGRREHSVQQRTHEIGIRMALGASPAQVLRAVVGEGIVLALAGVALGVAAAAGFVRFIAHHLFGVSATDPTAFAIGCMLLIVAATASYLPARRAAGVDPLVALRHE